LNNVEDTAAIRPKSMSKSSFLPYCKFFKPKLICCPLLPDGDSQLSIEADIREKKSGRQTGS
jgi:hypothetical protein